MRLCPIEIALEDASQLTEDYLDWISELVFRGDSNTDSHQRHDSSSENSTYAADDDDDDIVPCSISE